MNAKNKGNMVLGGVPRLNLLPPSHFEKIKTGQTVSSVLVWIILAVVIAMAGIALMWFYQNQRAEELARVQTENTTLQAERDNYPDVIELRRKLGEISVVEGAIPQNIDYALVLTEIYDRLPEEADIESLALVTIGSGEATQLMVTSVISTPVFISSADYADAFNDVSGFVRFEFQRSEERTETYEHTLVLFFDSASYPIEEGAAQ